MVLKQVSLAVLAATFITGSAAVAYAESGVGVAGAGASVSSSATMQNEWNQNASAGQGFAKERRLDHSNRKHTRQARMKHKSW